MLLGVVYTFLGLVTTHACLRMAKHDDPSLAPCLRRGWAWITFHGWAHLCLKLAKHKADNALSALIDQRFDSAEALLDEALRWVKRAGELEAHPRYAVGLDNVRRAVREAAFGLRAHAQFTVLKIDRLLTENNPSPTPCLAPSRCRPLSTRLHRATLKAA